MARPFRFGVNMITPADAGAWREKCRKAEALGFDVITVADHLGMPAPFPALVAAAEATERPRLGTFTLNAGFFNPTLLAREVATTDQLTGGRLELGLGTGYMKAEHDAAGLPFGTPAQRVAHLRHTVEELERLATAEDFAPHPVQTPRPPLLIGGNGNRVLELAARHADIVAFTGAAADPADPSGAPRALSAEEMDERVAAYRTFATTAATATTTATATTAAADTTATATADTATATTDTTTATTATTTTDRAEPGDRAEPAVTTTTDRTESGERAEPGDCTEPAIRAEPTVRAVPAIRTEPAELNLLIQMVVPTPDRRGTIRPHLDMIPHLTEDQALEVPILLIGTTEQIAEQLRAQRERYGFSYITVLEPWMDVFAPVIEVLRGE